MHTLTAFKTLWTHLSVNSETFIDILARSATLFSGTAGIRGEQDRITILMPVLVVHLFMSSGSCYFSLQLFFNFFFPKQYLATQKFNAEAIVTTVSRLLNFCSMVSVFPFWERLQYFIYINKYSKLPPLANTHAVATSWLILATIT